MLWSLQQAIYAALTTDVVLADKIKGVFDSVPQGDPFPYVVIGDGSAADFDTDDSTGYDADLMIHVWDRSHRGRRTVKGIQDDIHRILHRANPVVAGVHTVECFIEFTDSFQDSDGLTNHGVQRCRLIIDRSI